jgi:hypothetical protein
LVVGLTVAAAVVLVATACAASISTAAVPVAATTGPGLNQPVRDGKFEFVVKSVQCGLSTVGSGVLSETAQGQFCEVSLTVKNIGNQAQSFSGSDQKAIGADGAQFSNDPAAELAANPNDQTFLTPINPGNTVKGIVVFDIPTNASIKTLELHDSPFSNGVKVNVS